jgi:hypothetical protein
VNWLPLGICAAGVTTSSWPACSKLAATPSTLTLLTLSASRKSRLKRSRSIVAVAAIVARPTSRFFRGV